MLVKKRRSKRFAKDLDWAQELNLWLGAFPEAFESEAERRETWNAYYFHLMERYAEPGKRPQGWWDYEVEARPKGSQTQEEILHRIGDDADRAAIEALWNEELEWACRGVEAVGRNPKAEVVPNWYGRGRQTSNHRKRT